MSLMLPMLHDRDRVNIVEPGRLNAAVSFARASTATYLGPSGLASAIANALRFEYDATPNFLGLLIESAATNLMKYSEGDVTRYTTRSNVANAGATITGFANSIAVGDNSATRFAYTGSSATLTTGSTYTISAFVQMDDGLAPVPGVGKDFALICAGNSGGVSSVAKVNGSLYRVQSTAVAGTNTGNNGFLKSSSYTARTFRFSGFQIELSSAGTSYIPTNGATVTRAADVAQATSLSALGINTTAGTFVMVHDAPTGAPLLYSGSNPILVSQGGTKVAIAYDASGTTISVNGGTPTTGAALTWGTTLSILQSASAWANAHCKSLSWYNTKRTGDVQRLST